MRKIAFFFLTAFLAVAVMAQENPLWMRYPAISPDGKTIVFSYKGDLYKVPCIGGDINHSIRSIISPLQVKGVDTIMSFVYK